LKLLHVIDSRQLRGAEVFASDLVRALDEADVTQRVAVLHDESGSDVDYDAPVQSLGGNGWSLPLLHVSPQAVRALRGLIRTWGPDVVQAHGGHSLKHTMLASGTRRAPVVYRKIGLTPPDVIGGLRRGTHGYFMRKTTRIVAVAESVRKEILAAFRVPAERVVTIANAVDSRRMDVVKGAEATRRTLGIEPSTPIILSLGALTWEKDPLAHVAIGEQVLRRVGEAVHIIVGDGPLRARVEAAIAGRNLDGRMRLLTARPDVPDLLATSNVLLLASRTEGMPAAVIEAGMMGIPVAAYAIGGVPEVVLDGNTGRLATPGDEEGLAASVVDLLVDPETSGVMSTSARARCRQEFDISVIAPKYLKLYEELVAT
jgi:glycosyltransferase involved in cell wall biosynthesis